MQREVRELEKVDKTGWGRVVITMECLILSLASHSFFRTPPQCSQERTLKNDAYLHPNLGQYFHGSENIKPRNKKNKQIVSENCFVFRQLGAIKLF